MSRLPSRRAGTEWSIVFGYKAAERARKRLWRPGNEATGRALNNTLNNMLHEHEPPPFPRRLTLIRRYPDGRETTRVYIEATMPEFRARWDQLIAQGLEPPPPADENITLAEMIEVAEFMVAQGIFETAVSEDGVTRYLIPADDTGKRLHREAWNRPQ